MGSRTLTIYTCDWCEAEATGAHDGYSPDMPPKAWADIDHGRILCGECVQARDKALAEARAMRVTIGGSLTNSKGETE